VSDSSSGNVVLKTLRRSMRALYAEKCTPIAVCGVRAEGSLAACLAHACAISLQWQWRALLRQKWEPAHQIGAVRLVAWLQTCVGISPVR
jgi:hypothetical protein